jgi:hypothetical protein
LALTVRLFQQLFEVINHAVNRSGLGDVEGTDPTFLSIKSDHWEFLNPRSGHVPDRLKKGSLRDKGGYSRRNTEQYSLTSPWQYYILGSLLDEYD